MKAVWYEKQGAAPEVLVYGEIPTPTPGPGEVRVRLRASAVNPADANRRAGRLHGMEFAQIIPNSDGAGVIDAVGEGVNTQRVGERVWVYFGQRGRAFGTAAQYICLPEELACTLPDHLSDEEGACLGIPGMTAYLALFDENPIQGRVVLVTGGAGAVGHYAVQLAKWGGAKVIATVSNAEKAEHARRAGADTVVLYTAADALQQVRDAAGPQGVHRIVDVDAVANSELVMNVASEGATWVSYAIGPKAVTALPLSSVIRKNLRLRGLYLSGLSAPVRREAQLGVQRWAQETPAAIHSVDQCFPLKETAQAHLAVEAKKKMGTVVVLCDESALPN